MQCVSLRFLPDKGSYGIRFLVPLCMPAWPMAGKGAFSGSSFPSGHAWHPLRAAIHLLPAAGKCQVRIHIA